MLFQDKLKELRKKKNVSQYELADALKISRSVVAKWETGLVMPSEENISLLLEYFNITREELLPNEKTNEIIVLKNKSIKKMKKAIISLSTLVLVILLAIVLSNIRFADKLSRDMRMLGNIDEVEIYLYDEFQDITYELTDEEYKDIVLTSLQKVKYKTFPDNVRVDIAFGQYTIILKGVITIRINRSFVSVDNKFYAVKEFSGSESVEGIIEHLSFRILSK